MQFPLRLATPADTEIIAWHRAQMFQDMGMVPEHLFQSFRTRALDRLRAAVAAGEYIGWLVPDPNDAQKIIAGASVILRQVPPFPLRRAGGEVVIADGNQALIVNVLTEPEWRRRGLARLLMERIIAWSREQRVESIILHASDEGHALYQRLGFIPTTEMRLSG